MRFMAWFAQVWDLYSDILFVREVFNTTTEEDNPQYVVIFALADSMPTGVP